MSQCTTNAELAGGPCLSEPHGARQTQHEPVRPPPLVSQGVPPTSELCKTENLTYFYRLCT